MMSPSGTSRYVLRLVLCDLERGEEDQHVEISVDEEQDTPRKINRPQDFLARGPKSTTSNKTRGNNYDIVSKNCCKNGELTLAELPLSRLEHAGAGAVAGGAGENKEIQQLIFHAGRDEEEAASRRSARSSSTPSGTVALRFDRQTKNNPTACSLHFFEQELGCDSIQATPTSLQKFLAPLLGKVVEDSFVLSTAEPTSTPVKDTTRRTSSVVADQLLGPPRPLQHTDHLKTSRDTSIELSVSGFAIVGSQQEEKQDQHQRLSAVPRVSAASVSSSSGGGVAADLRSSRADLLSSATADEAQHQLPPELREELINDRKNNINITPEEDDKKMKEHEESEVVHRQLQQAPPKRDEKRDMLNIKDSDKMKNVETTDIKFDMILLPAGVQDVNAAGAVKLADRTVLSSAFGVRWASRTWTVWVVLVTGVLAANGLSPLRSGFRRSYEETFLEYVGPHDEDFLSWNNDNNNKDHQIIRDVSEHPAWKEECRNVDMDDFFSAPRIEPVTIVVMWIWLIMHRTNLDLAKACLRSVDTLLLGFAWFRVNAGRAANLSSCYTPLGPKGSATVTLVVAAYAIESTGLWAIMSLMDAYDLARKVRLCITAFCVGWFVWIVVQVRLNDKWNDAVALTVRTGTADEAPLKFDMNRLVFFVRGDAGVVVTGADIISTTPRGQAAGGWIFLIAIFCKHFWTVLRGRYFAVVRCQYNMVYVHRETRQNMSVPERQAFLRVSRSLQDKERRRTSRSSRRQSSARTSLFGAPAQAGDIKSENINDGDKNNATEINRTRMSASVLSAKLNNLALAGSRRATGSRPSVSTTARPSTAAGQSTPARRSATSRASSPISAVKKTNQIQQILPQMSHSQKTCDTYRRRGP